MFAAGQQGSNVGRAPAPAVAALRNLTDNVLRYSPTKSLVNVVTETDGKTIRFRVIDLGTFKPSSGTKADLMAFPLSLATCADSWPPASDGPRLAIDVYVSGVAQGIASMAVCTERMDGLVFPGGIGTHAADIRARVTDQPD